MTRPKHLFFCFRSKENFYLFAYAYELKLDVVEDAIIRTITALRFPNEIIVWDKLFVCATLTETFISAVNEIANNLSYNTRITRE